MRKMKVSIWICACIVALGALCTGCEADPIRIDEGKMPGEGGGELTWETTGRILGYGSPTARVIVAVTEATRDVPVFFQLEKPLKEDVTVRIALSFDGQIYSGMFGGGMNIFPEDYMELSSGTLTVKAGETRSNTAILTIDRDGFGTLYSALVGVVVEEVVEGNVDITDNDVVFVVAIRPTAVEADAKKGIRVVTYVDTEKVKPEIAAQFYAEMFLYEDFSPVGTYQADPFIDMVNLNVSQVKWDEQYNRAVLFFNDDISHVLTNHDKYISPLQDMDVDVCLVIRGGNTGIGFSNLTDAQIEDLAAQVASAVNRYGLDGVNLWDEDAGYGREGSQPVTLTSYPKFIKALRDKMPDKLITLVDVSDPTSTFDEANGGIRVGDLIDYAWHGYPSLTYVNPWKGEQDRSPILGLTPDRYAMVFQKFEPIDAMQMEMKMEEIILGGLNKVFVFDNLPSFYQGGEGIADATLFLAAFFGSLDAMFFGEGYEYLIMGKQTWNMGGYDANIWAKDW